jgi:phospholipase/lecithinase/hemolysin
VKISLTQFQFTDVYNEPQKYLNGTDSANVQSWIDQCDVQGNNCTLKSSPDSYLWYDELHPSEQADRIIANEFAKVVSGNSEFTEYFSLNS